MWNSISGPFALWTVMHCSCQTKDVFEEKCGYFCSNSWEGGWLVLEDVDPHFNRKRNGAAFFPCAKWWQQHFSGCLFKINQHLMAKQSAKISIKERGVQTERDGLKYRKGKKKHQHIRSSCLEQWPASASLPLTHTHRNTIRQNPY